MEERLQEMSAQVFAAEREWTVDGIPVLTATVSLPRPAEDRSRAARRIRRFYQLQARSYLRYCENWLFPWAAAEYRRALETSAPLPCCTADLTHRVTCCQDGVWSLYTESRERMGGRTELLRRGDTWSLADGYPLPLAAFFPKREPVKRTLLALAAEEIAAQEAAGVARYHDKWRQQLRRSFNRENFFVTPEGLSIFWQMYAIAPAAEGIPTFTLPFGRGNCRFPGETAEKTAPSH